MKKYCEISGVEIPSDEAMKKTQRGFSIIEFTDTYGQEITIQKSSGAMYDAIWFGVSNTGPNIPGPSGSMGEDVNFRAHINQEQAAMIIKHLKKFIETGDL